MLWKKLDREWKLVVNGVSLPDSPRRHCTAGVHITGLSMLMFAIELELRVGETSYSTLTSMSCYSKMEYTKRTRPRTFSLQGTNSKSNPLLHSQYVFRTQMLLKRSSIQGQTLTYSQSLRRLFHDIQRRHLYGCICHIHLPRVPLT
jgi:hypothetical protein